MVDISKARPHVLRIAVVAAFVLILLFFSDAFVASSATAVHRFNSPGSTQAVTHIVLFQFKKDADPAAVASACAKMMALKETCVWPDSERTYIQSITGGKDNSVEGLGNGATHAFVVQFANAEDRNYYVVNDPVHEAFKKEIGPLVEDVTVMDFTNGVF